MGTSSGEYELNYECARRQTSDRFRIFIQTLNPNFHSMKITLSMCQLHLGIYRMAQVDISRQFQPWYVDVNISSF